MMKTRIEGVQKRIRSNRKVPSQYGTFLIPITKDTYLNLVYFSATMLPQKDEVLKLYPMVMK